VRYGTVPYCNNLASGTIDFSINRKRGDVRYLHLYVTVACGMIKEGSRVVRIDVRCDTVRHGMPLYYFNIFYKFTAVDRGCRLPLAFFPFLARDSLPGPTFD
jgi:hypothetical protein